MGLTSWVQERLQYQQGLALVRRDPTNPAELENHLGLSKAQISMFFERFDTNHDGKLSMDELNRGELDLGVC